MKILLFGKGGQVGWELQRALAPLGEVVALGKRDADFNKLEGLQSIVTYHSPAVVVNAAAYTAVDKAEEEIDEAYRINCEAVGILANEAARLGAWLVHYSTDYVFDGEKSTPYREDDPTAPLSAYGRSKVASEEQIRMSGVNHFIFRTGWVYSARGTNFVKTILRMASERDDLRIVADQYGSPTSASLLAAVTVLALYRLRMADFASSLSGTYHVAAAGCTSWFDFARFILALAQARGASIRMQPDQIEPIPSSAYVSATRRPKNSCLDTSKLRQTFDLQLPQWDRDVRRMIEEITLA